MAATIPWQKTWWAKCLFIGLGAVTGALMRKAPAKVRVAGFISTAAVTSAYCGWEILSSIPEVAPRIATGVQADNIEEGFDLAGLFSSGYLTSGLVSELVKGR